MCKFVSALVPTLTLCLFYTGLFGQIIHHTLCSECWYTSEKEQEQWRINRVSNKNCRFYNLLMAFVWRKNWWEAWHDKIIIIRTTCRLSLSLLVGKIWNMKMWRNAVPHTHSLQGRLTVLLRFNFTICHPICHSVINVRLHAVRAESTGLGNCIKNERLTMINGDV